MHAQILPLQLKQWERSTHKLPHNNNTEKIKKTVIQELQAAVLVTSQTISLHMSQQISHSITDYCTCPRQDQASYYRRLLHLP